MGQHAKHRSLVKLTALAIGLWAAPAQACRLALVLAMDVSSSVDATEDQLQRAGLAAALIDPDVQAAFFVSADPVALHVFEWSGRYNQATLQDWLLIEGPEDLLNAATQISLSDRSQTESPTAVGYALGHAATQLAKAPPCAAQTIDLASDGINNEGFGPAEAYAAFPFAGVIVNGLVVKSGPATEQAAIIAYYRDEVIRGPASFVEVADGFEEYAAVMRRKLLRELTSQMMGAIPQPRGFAG